MNAENTDTMKGKYLTFWTDKRLFGIPIADVVQIVKVQQITEIPEFPSYAKGIINLRGSIIPVIDIRLRIGKDEIAYDEHTCIIVTNISERYVGFIVDSVEEVAVIEDDEISAPPRMSEDYTNTFLTGIGKHEKRIVLLLDAQKILSENELESISQDPPQDAAE